MIHTDYRGYNFSCVRMNKIDNTTHILCLCQIFRIVIREFMSHKWEMELRFPFHSLDCHIDRTILTFTKAESRITIKHSTTQMNRNIV